MKLTHIFFLIILIITSSCQTNGQKENPSDIKYFYKTSKPYTRWWWFASIIKKEDIRYQLDWVKENNFGGVEIAWVYPLNRKRFARDHHDVPYMPRQEWLSSEWTDVVTYAKKYCDSIGLGCDFTFGTGWPFGDTKVPYKDATKIFNHPHSDLKETYYTVSWEYPERGYIIDHMNKEAFSHYAERMGKALEPALKGSISGLFVDSWEVETRWIWTDGFDKEFEKRYGYDITGYMPDIYESVNAPEYYDYMKLVSDYVINEFYVPFSDKCHQLGAFSRAQCSGAPVDIINAYAAVDVPESEAMLYEPPYSKIPASAAALSGKKEVTSETFTCTYGFPERRDDGTTDFMKRGEEKADDLKLVADALFANGVNQIIWHGMPYNPIGVDTNRFYATVHVGRSGSLSKDLKAFNKYMEKVSYYMKRGVTYSDVAVYLPLEDAWMGQEMDQPDPQMPWAWGEYEMRKIETPGVLKAYHPLWINAAFLEKAKLNNGRLKIGDCSFSSLYIDVKYLDIATLKVLLNIAGQGFPLCMKNKAEQAGKNRSSEFDKMMEKLLSMGNVYSSFNNIVASKPLIQGDIIPDFWCRQDDDRSYLFFANPCSSGLELPLEYGKAASCEDLSLEVVVNIYELSIEIELDFKENQSLLFVVEKNGEHYFENISLRL